MPIVAAYWASKLSYMKRVISEVFPTDCSPRKTSLNFRSGFEKEVSAIVRVRLRSGYGGLECEVKITRPPSLGFVPL